MWLPTLICLFICIKVSSAEFLDEVQILKKSFAEGLQADPALSGDVLTPVLKMFIDTKIARMEDLLSSTRFTHSQRTKRDLNTSEKTSVIEIRKEGKLLNTNLQDLRLSTRKNRTLVVALEIPDHLAIYNYQNATFTKLLNITAAFQTNLATISLKNSTLIVLGDARRVKVIELDLKNVSLKVIHTIRVSNPQHVVLWKQSQEQIFLSVTWQKVSSKVVTVYKWLGRHFDFLQDIEESVGVVKSVPFSIHGSFYLALVNSETKKPFKKSYSDIFKFNHDNETFKLFRRLPTDGCRDIKYFQARLHGDDHHFFIVVYGMPNFYDQQSISVIYKYEDGYFFPFQTVESYAVEWQPIQDNSGNTALIAPTDQGLQGFQYDGWQFSQSNVTARFSINGTVGAFHTFQNVLVMACSQCNLPSNVFTFNFSSTNLVRKQHNELLTWCQNTLHQLDSVYYESESPSSRALSAGSLRGDLTEKFTISNQERQLAAINQLNHSLTILEEAVKEIFDRDWNLTNIQANKVIFNNKTSVNFLQTNLINNQSVDLLLDNLLNLEKGFDLDELDVEVAILENDVQFLMLNNRSVNDYVLSNPGSVQEVVVGHSANFTQGFNVSSINQKIRVSEEELLLNDGDQVFSWDLNLDNLVAEQLNATNGSDYLNLEVSHVDSLKVDNLEVGGLINRVDFPLLAAGSLKKASNTTQVLHVPLYANQLEAENITVTQPLADFLLVNHPGNYTINRNVTFSKIYTANLQTHSINNIQISDPEEGFNLLQNTKQEAQVIKGNLTLDNIKITNLTRHNVSSAENIKVLRHLTANDIISSTGKSLRTKLLSSLKLTDQKVSVRLHFTQPVEAYDVIADKVNEVEPQNWLLQKSDDTQVLTGQKRFLGDLTLKGTQNIFNLNGIKVQEFENGLLKINGDQELSGHFTIDRAVFKQGLQYNESKITAIKTMIVNGNLKVANTTTSGLSVWGLVNDQNLNNTNNDFTSGLKNFTTLYVENLNLGPSELLDLVQDIHNDHLVLNHQHLQLPNSVEIENLKFSGTLNGNMTQDDFKGLMTLQSEEDILVATDMEYDSMTVLGEVSITDGYINGHNLTRLEKETVKIDEDHEFDKVTFDEDIIVEGGVTVEGNIENLDLDEIVTQDDSELYLENKIFKGPVMVNGTLFIKNKVSGLELHKFCAISNSSNTLNRLVIEGDVMFAKGPKVHTLNNMNLQHLKKSVWFSDVSANISGSLLLGNVTIQADLYVKNNVDDVNWNNLIQNYFSKTKSQEIPRSYTFAQVVFKSLCSPQMNVNTINNITIDDIPKVLLLQDVDQIFEEIVYFEEVSVPELYEDVLVNGLSLKSDVMRYDQINVVTGFKTVENLTVDILKLPHNVKIQGVDVLDWLENAVLTSGSFNIKGAKSFKNATFEQGLSLKGSLNNLKFDSASIMLVDQPQKVRGKKVFTGSVRAENLRTHGGGLINGIDLEVLVANQATKHGNKSINSDLVFSGNLNVDNLNLHGQKYNGVNVTQLIGNLTKLHKLGGLSSHFDSLFDLSVSIQKALAGQQSLFEDFKEVNQFTEINDIFGLKSHDGSSKLITYSLQNGAGMLQMFELDNFILVNRLDTSRLTFLQPITLQGLDYLYVEQYSHTDYYRRSTPIFYGNLLNPDFEYVNEFYMAPTVSLTSFTHPATNETCMVFVSSHLKLADVFCSWEFPSQFGLKKKIFMDGVYKVAAFEIGQGVVYLFLVGKGTAPFRESRIKIFKVHSGKEEFENVQVIYESALLNDLALATINDKHYVAFSFESLKPSSGPGWVSIFRLNSDSGRFEHWQHIPVKNPQGVEFITETTVEPLLLISTTEIGNSLNVFRYEGVAGFHQILKGSALPVGSRLKVIGNGRFVALMETHKKLATVLSTITRGV